MRICFFTHAICSGPPLVSWVDDNLSFRVQSRLWSPGRDDLAAWAWCATLAPRCCRARNRGDTVQGRCWGQGDNTDSVGGWDTLGVVTWLELYPPLVVHYLQ